MLLPTLLKHFCDTQGLFVSVVTLLVTLYVLCILAPMNAGMNYFAKFPLWHWY